MKHVYELEFKKRKAIIEDDGENSKNYRMDILDEGALDEVLMVH